MSKRQKPMGILYTPIPDLFIKGVGKISPELARDTKDSCLIDREEALFAEYGLERPNSLDPATRSLIQQMAIKLKYPGFTDFTKTKRPGHPTKWLGHEGVLLVERAEKYKAENPKMSWSDIMKKVKKDLKYTGSAKNLYLRFCGILKNPLSHASIAKAYKANGRDSLTSEQRKKMLEIESVM